MTIGRDRDRPLARRTSGVPYGWPTLFGVGTMLVIFGASFLIYGEVVSELVFVWAFVNLLVAAFWFKT